MMKKRLNKNKSALKISLSLVRLKLFPIIFLTILLNCKNEKKSIAEDLQPLLSIGFLTYSSTSPFDSLAEKDVDLGKFVGTWKEMQRINNSFQSGLSKSQATYSDLGNRTIGVLNEGTSTDGARVALNGVALIPDPSIGRLKVSFAFPFFFGDFLIIRIDRTNYKTAMIGGPTPNFLWIFSREESIDSSTENSYIEFAKAAGYNTNELKRYR